MGLLDKAKGTQNNTNTGLISLYKKLDSVNQGVDFSVLLFRNLVDFLEVDKAALFLLSEKSDNYGCLLTKGYDKTTSNRLRLDDHSIDSKEFVFIKSNRKPYHSEDPPYFLKDFMSSREYGLLEDIYWLPFFIEDDIYAMIMISQWCSSVPDTWETIFDSISKKYSLIVFNSRKSLVKSSQVSVNKVNRNDLLAFFERYGDKNLLIIKIDINPLIQLLSLSDGLSHVNIKREIFSVIKTMTGSEQGIFELQNNQLLLILDNNRIPDKDLFLHQISASLPLLFQDLETAPSIQYQIYDNPVDVESRESLLSELI